MSRPTYDPCPNCCECPSPLFYVSSRSASVTPNGYYNGVWNKSYSQAYSVSYVTGSAGSFSTNVGGSFNYNGTYNPNTRIFTQSAGGSTAGTSISYFDTPTVTATAFASLNSFPATGYLNNFWSGWNFSYDDGRGNDGAGSGLHNWNPDYTSANGAANILDPVTYFFHVPGYFSLYPGTSSYSGQFIQNIITYSDPLTLSDQMSAAVGMLPTGWPALAPSASGTVLASQFTTGLSYTILESRYQWRHQPSPTSYYKITWTEVFVPRNGTAPSGTAQSYVWDKTTPSGFSYTGTDTTHYPSSQVYEIDYPSTDGYFFISGLSVTCIPPAHA